jgi:hypothetical protein
MSIAGQWAVTMSTPIGTMQFTWEFASEGSGWKGAMIGQPPVGNSELRSIDVSGDAVSFQTTTPSPMGALDLAFTGLVANEAMTGTCKTRFGDNAFAAKRLG